jgi:hypothetical protein
MPAIKDMSKIKETWKRRSQASTPDYEDGVRNPKTDWAAATAAAEKNYNAGVNAAMGRGAFGKGVKTAGTEAWQKGAIEKGVRRWADGILLAEDKYVEGFAPYASVIANTKLPPRGPKGDPKNIERVRVMAAKLHEEKIRRTTA